MAREQRDQEKSKEREEERMRERDRESELRKEKVPFHTRVHPIFIDEQLSSAVGAIDYVRGSTN